MDLFYGFDLGDAESAVARLKREERGDPEILAVGGEKSFVTAFAATGSGQLLIGEPACYAQDARRRALRFKSAFLTDPAVPGDVRSFAAGVLGELYTSGSLVRGSDSCFYVGCPAGWDRQAREEYRAIFEQAGYPPVRIVSESRAALVSACQSRHLQVGHDILSKAVLVVDIGSSTTDFAYVCRGREVEMRTAGEVRLGGGIMDELLLEEAVRRSDRAEEIRGIFKESEPWRTYCEFAARRLKERYYGAQPGEEGQPEEETVLIRYGKPVRLKLRIDREIADVLTEGPSERLGGSSFRATFLKSLRDVREGIGEELPELIFLTGGVSRMPGIRAWCAEVFPEAVVITGLEPEFQVARGLALSGRIDDELRMFREEIRAFNESKTVEEIVEGEIDALYAAAVETLAKPILEHAAEPVFEKWRSGEIDRLSDADEVLRAEIERFLHSDEARELLSPVIGKWLAPVAERLEEHTVPICIRHHVPYTALSLSSYLTAEDLDIELEAKNLFAVEELTLLIDSIISLLVGLICGGSGIALISAGPNGIIAGALVSLVVLILGKKRMEAAFLDAKIPVPMRKLVSRRAFRSRVSALAGGVRRDLLKSLAGERNEEITSRMVSEISAQIEECLTKMAAVVEIPLG